MLSEDLHPIFEIISPANQVVVQYRSTSLELLQIRDSRGSYKNSVHLQELSDSYGIPLVSFVKDISLEELRGGRDTSEDIEGGVVTFEDGLMAKVKISKYVEKHGKIADLRDNFIVREVLCSRSDDLVSLLVPGSEQRKHVEEISEKIKRHCTESCVRVLYEFSKYVLDNGPWERKQVVIDLKNSGTKWFQVLMKMYGLDLSEAEEVVPDHVRDYILVKTKNLKDSIVYIESL